MECSAGEPPVTLDRIGIGLFGQNGLLGKLGALDRARKRLPVNVVLRSEIKLSLIPPQGRWLVATFLFVEEFPLSHIH